MSNPPPLDNSYYIRPLQPFGGDEYQIVALEGAPSARGEFLGERLRLRTQENHFRHASRLAEIFREEISELNESSRISESRRTTYFLGLFGSDAPKRTLLAAVAIGTNVIGRQREINSLHTRFHLTSEYRFNQFPTLRDNFIEGVAPFISETLEKAERANRNLARARGGKETPLSVWLPIEKPAQKIEPQTPLGHTLRALLEHQYVLTQTPQSVAGYMMAQKMAI